MRIASVVGYVISSLFLLLVFTSGCSAGVYAVPSPQLGIYVSYGPPPIPIYDQPICPGDDYIWVPGYWAWDGYEYYWVPGTWVMAPEIGFFWTPGYWEWIGTAFFFHEGYWGPHVGWYGGINYGFGYYGHGYEGGHWDHGHFFYNRAVNHVDVNIRNVYNTPISRENMSRVSYNGGQGGINERPNPEEQRYSRERHVPPTQAQSQHVEAARGNRELQAPVNQGRPPVAATGRPGAFNDHAVGATEPGGRYEPPPNAGVNTARPVIHPNDLPPLQRPTPPSTGNPNLDQKYQKQGQNLYDNQNQARQRLQQQQEKQDQNLTRKNPNPAQQQQMEQRHQQQTQQMQQRQTQQQQQMQQRQQPRGQSGTNRH